MKIGSISVYLNKDESISYIARIIRDGKKYQGTFKTKEEAQKFCDCIYKKWLINKADKKIKEKEETILLDDKSGNDKLEGRITKLEKDINPTITRINDFFKLLIEFNRTIGN